MNLLFFLRSFSLFSLTLIIQVLISPLVFAQEASGEEASTLENITRIVVRLVPEDFRSSENENSNDSSNLSATGVIVGFSEGKYYLLTNAHVITDQDPLTGQPGICQNNCLVFPSTRSSINLIGTPIEDFSEESELPRISRLVTNSELDIALVSFPGAALQYDIADIQLPLIYETDTEVYGFPQGETELNSRKIEFISLADFQGYDCPSDNTNNIYSNRYTLLYLSEEQGFGNGFSGSGIVSPSGFLLGIHARSSIGDAENCGGKTGFGISIQAILEEPSINSQLRRILTAESENSDNIDFPGNNVDSFPNRIRQLRLERLTDPGFGSDREP